MIDLEKIPEKDVIFHFNTLRSPIEYRQPWKKLIG